MKRKKWQDVKIQKKREKNLINDNYMTKKRLYFSIKRCFLNVLREIKVSRKKVIKLITPQIHPRTQFSWIMIDWVSIVRHSRRRFSVLSFAGGGRQRRGGNFCVPKSHHSKSMTINQQNANDSTQADEKNSSTCCFSNVRKFLCINFFTFLQLLRSKADENHTRVFHFFLHL